MVRPEALPHHHHLQCAAVRNCARIPAADSIHATRPMRPMRPMQAIRTLESKVAKAVGLAQVYTQYGNLAEPSYRTFLERLAALAAARGPAGGGGFQPLSLCVLPPVPQIQASSVAT